MAHSPAEEGNAESLAKMLTELHSATARWVNRLDSEEGRKVWHNFRESKLTFQRSYLARLNYTHQNAVKHGLVPVAALYPWCSAGWFEKTASPAEISIIYGFKIDGVKVFDEFEPEAEW